MVDIASIGSSGLGAYQRALATTSNNIANLQTDGYVRQRSVLQVAGQDTTARVSIGAGVRFAQVERLYDQYAEENLRRATSDLKSDESLLTGLQQLQDAIGSTDAGLHGAFQNFFNSARDLEAAPSSPGTRAGFVAAADGLATRFRGLASTVENLDAGSKAQITQAVGEVNSILEQLGQLNALLVKRSSDSEQPMQLLDQRDAALKKLSERLGITTQFGPSGAVAVYAGDSASGISLVEASQAKQIQVQFDPYDYGKASFLTNSSGGTSGTLDKINTGILGGLVQFRGQGLGPTASKLDELALSFGKAVNKAHRQGLDGLGRAGGDVFYVGPKFVVDGRANSGTARVQVDVVNADAVEAHSYELRFDGTHNRWQVQDMQTGAISSGTDNLQLGGLKFSMQGTPKDGDIFRIVPESHPASTFENLLKQGSDVASAAKLATSAGSTNIGSAAANVMLAASRIASAFSSIMDVLPRGPSPVSYAGASGASSASNLAVKGTVTSFGGLPKSASEGDAYLVTNNAHIYQWTSGTWVDAGPGIELKPSIFTATSQPLAVIPAGLSDVQLSVWNNEPGQIAIFTRDGRQLAGPKVDGSAVVTAANGFYDGATYSDAYLNKTGAENYLGQDFIRGVMAKSATQTDASGGVLRSGAAIYSRPLDLADLRKRDSISIRINGKSFDVPIKDFASDSDQNFAAKLVSAVNGHQLETNAVAELQADGSLKISARQAVDIDISAMSDGKGLSFGDTGSASAQSVRQSPLFLSATGANPVTAAKDLRDKINASKLAVASFIDASGHSVTDAQVTADCKLVVSNSQDDPVSALTIGTNDFGIPAGVKFNDASISVDAAGSEAPAVLKELGLNAGFVMTKPIAEDLLVFGVGSDGAAARVALTADYGDITQVQNLQSDQRQYSLRFAAGGRYAITDITDGVPGTEVSSGVFDLQTREISYGKWKVSLDGIPADGDSYTIAPNTDYLGDNRIAAVISNLQNDRGILASNQTVQQEYEGLVNSMGAITAQADIAKQAQKVVLDHASQARDSVSGVNLDEELADLLRFQQAYQANAQVVQVANRLFDALLQKL